MDHNNYDKSKKPIFVLQTYEDRIAGKELSQKLSERLATLSLKETLQDRLLTSSNSRQAVVAENNGVPPPPPPPPSDDIKSHGPFDMCPPPNSQSNTLKPNKIKPKAPPVPIKLSTLSSSSSSSYFQAPPCPTPDYDTLSITSSTTTSSSLPPKQTTNNGYNNNNLNGGTKQLPSQNNHHISDTVEMESLESFKLNNPLGIRPKPPDTYFNKLPLTAQLSNGSTTSTTSTLMRKKQRPISVTIGEYPSGTLRKQPGRLDFLHNGNGTGRTSDVPISSQLASELAQTLNRSNLKKRTESMENLLNCSPHNNIKPQINGSVRISLNNSLAKSLAKSTNDLSTIEHFPKNVCSRVTININNNNNVSAATDKKLDAPNGILKNGNQASPPPHKSLVQQKSITFGEMPTVIIDRPLHVA